MRICNMIGKGPSYSPQFGFAEGDRNFGNCAHI